MHTALRRMRLCLELAKKLRVAAWMTTAASDLRAWRRRYALWMTNVARLTGHPHECYIVFSREG